MWITLRGKQAIRLSLKSVSAASGLGLGQLRFGLEATATDEVADKAPLWLSGSLHATNLGAYGGYLTRLNSDREPIHLSPGRGSRSLSLIADLSYTQLQVIEDNRTTSLQLSLDIAGHVLIDAEPEVFFGNRIECNISQSHWIELIEQMHYRRLMLVEIDAPDSARTPRESLASTYLRTAQKHFLEHDWRLTVEAVRQCLGALVGESADEEKTEAEVKLALKELRNKSQKERVGYIERYEPIRRALKFHADLGSHPEVAETTKQHAHASLLMAWGLLKGLAGDR